MMNTVSGENPYKIYVSVTVRFETDGSMRPVTLHWADGRRYRIDRVIDVRTAASMKAGGAGDRYTCVINGKGRFLFFENGRWFVENSRL